MLKIVHRKKTVTISALSTTSIITRQGNAVVEKKDDVYLKPQQNTPTSTGGEMNAGFV